MFKWKRFQAQVWTMLPTDAEGLLDWILRGLASGLGGIHNENE